MIESTSYEGFLNELAATARASDHVVGLVAFGSTAEGRHRDEWSDHDFALLTEPGTDDIFRKDLSWLPHASSIVLSVVEQHGGVKVLYDNGHRLEFGITDVESFAAWAGAPATVLVGDDSVREATRAVIARRPGGETDAAREIRLMITQIHAGVCRARRGEQLSGSSLVRGEAVDHFLRAAAARLARDTTLLDPLDPHRRFEIVFPALGSLLENAMQRPVEEAARQLVNAAAEQLATDWEEFPHAALAAVRKRFEWN